MLTQPLFFGSEIYRGSVVAPWHPLRIARVSTVMDLVRAMGWLPPDQYVTSPRAKPAALGLWHDADYLAALQRAEAEQAVTPEDRERYNLGTASNPVYTEVYRRPATGAGGAMLAAERLASGGVVFHPGGGTHHGMKARANGFCYLNDVVLAILTLRRLGVRRVAYVDIDAHHPDGVEAAFAGDPDVRLISVHEEKRWPFTGTLTEDGGGNCFNLPVPAAFNDTEMEFALQELILPLVAEFAPDAVILQCGADAVEEDPLSRMALSNNAHWRVVAALRGLAPRYMVTGGGGYNPWTVGRLWAGNWAVLQGVEIPDELPRAAVEIQRSLSWNRKGKTRQPGEHLFTTMRDAPRNGPLRREVRERVAHLMTRAPKTPAEVG